MGTQAPTNQRSNHEFGPFEPNIDFFCSDVTVSSLENRKILINREISDSIIELAVMHIDQWNEDDDINETKIIGYERQPIVILINSAGGVCTEGMALVSAIEQSSTPVVTIAIGKAYSMAFTILAAGHYRYAYRHAALMYHQSSYGEMGMLQDHGDMFEWTTAVQERMDRIILDRTNITKAMLAKVNKEKKDWYMFPEKAYELGVIDDIFPVMLQPKKQPKGRVYGK